MLCKRLSDNLLFLVIQGRYGKGEAKETSDIYPVIIPRQCGKDELLRYRDYIDTFPEKDILCGFVSFIDEPRAWKSTDRAQFIILLIQSRICGNFSELCSPITWDDIRRAVQQGACAIYHATSHNILHERDWAILPEHYKSSRFTIRMKHYLQTGVYLSTFRELTAVVDEEEKIILEAQNPSAEDVAFMLLEWASKTMRDIKAD